MNNNHCGLLNEYFNSQRKIPKFLLSDPLWNKNYLDDSGIKYEDEIQSIVKSNCKLVEDFHCNFNIGFFGFFPEINEVLGHKGWLRFHGDVYQRKFIELMSREEYQELIQDSAQFINTHALTRLYEKINPENLHKAYEIFSQKLDSYYRAQKILETQYGIDNKYLEIISAPLDVIGDYLRGTKNLLMDMHNCPELVKEAAFSLVDVLFKKALYGRKTNKNKWLLMPLHIPAILSVNDFSNFFFPSYKELIDQLLEEGFIILILIEGKVERLLDKIFEIDSPNIIFHFEEDIPAIVKKKMNSTNCISGFFPVHLLKYGSNEECSAYATKLLQTLEGSNYFFSTNRVIYSPTDVDTRKLKLVYQYVEDYRR